MLEYDFAEGVYPNSEQHRIARNNGESYAMEDVPSSHRSAQQRTFNRDDATMMFDQKPNFHGKKLALMATIEEVNNVVIRETPIKGEEDIAVYAFQALGFEGRKSIVVWACEVTLHHDGQSGSSSKPTLGRTRP